MESTSTDLAPPTEPKEVPEWIAIVEAMGETPYQVRKTPSGLAVVKEQVLTVGQYL